MQAAGKLRYMKTAKRQKNTYFAQNRTMIWSSCILLKPGPPTSTLIGAPRWLVDCDVMEWSRSSEIWHDQIIVRVLSEILVFRFSVFMYCNFRSAGLECLDQQPNYLDLADWPAILGSTTDHQIIWICHRPSNYPQPTVKLFRSTTTTTVHGFYAH